MTTTIKWSIEGGTYGSYSSVFLADVDKSILTTAYVSSGVINYSGDVYYFGYSTGYNNAYHIIENIQIGDTFTWSNHQTSQLTIRITSKSITTWKIIDNISKNISPTDNPIYHNYNGYQISIDNIITPLQNIIETNTTNRVTYNWYTDSIGFKKQNSFIKLPQWNGDYHFENGKYDLKPYYRLNSDVSSNIYSCKKGYFPNQQGMSKTVDQWGKIIIPGYWEERGAGTAKYNIDIQKCFRIWKNGNSLYIMRCPSEYGIPEETTIYTCKSNSIILDLVANGGQGGQYYYNNVSGYDPVYRGGGGGGGSFIRVILNLNQATSPDQCFFINLNGRLYSNNSYPNNHVVLENGYFVSKRWCSLSYFNNDINSGYICLQCGGDGIANNTYYAPGGGGKISFTGDNNINNMADNNIDVTNAISTYNANYSNYIKILSAYWGKNGGRGSIEYNSWNADLASASGTSFVADDIYNSCGDITSYSVYKASYHGVGGTTSTTLGYGGGGASAIGIGTSDGLTADYSGVTGWGGGDCGRQYSGAGQPACAIIHW